MSCLSGGSFRTIGNVCAWRLALRVDVLEPTLGELIRESILTTDAQAQA
ncbi:hypothetical protein [Pseudomonas aeruginosa]|nr:hypothetical protein [Pseudomonas aeruginosa]